MLVTSMSVGFCALVVVAGCWLWRRQRRLVNNLRTSRDRAQLDMQLLNHQMHSMALQPEESCPSLVLDVGGPASLSSEPISLPPGPPSSGGGSSRSSHHGGRARDSSSSESGSETRNGASQAAAKQGADLTMPLRYKAVYEATIAAARARTWDAALAILRCSVGGRY